MRKGQAKTRYFKKDYAPARIMAERRRANTTLGKVSAQLKTTARKTTHALQQTARNLSARATKSLTAHRPTAYRATSHSRATSRRKVIPKKPLSWDEITLLSIVGTSVVAIIFSFAFAALHDPVKRSERELAKLADAYYVEYLYPRTLSGNFDDAATILGDFTVQGLPSIRLRQLLLFNDGKYASSATAFSNSYYECDTNRTYVRYYPVAPFGPRDYTVQYGTACEKVGLAE